jgi:signal transduction histidine kinase
MNRDDPSSHPILTFTLVLHDLRNELTLLAASVDAVTRAVPSGVARAELDALLTCADRATALTQELLVNTLIGAQPQPAPPSAVDLNGVIRSSLSGLKRILGTGISVKLQLSTDQARVAAETIQIERILVNLVLNARDAMPEGGALLIQTTVVDETRSTAGEHVPAHVRLTVTDTGVGMCPEVKGRIFEPLFTTKRKGTGLGLNSVAQTVRRLHGTISVESGVNCGTEITVTLPLAHSR